MSCPRTREIERVLDARELRAFCEHAEQCAECGVYLERTEVAYRALRADKLSALSPAKRVGLLAEIEKRASRPRLSLRWGWAALPAALAAAAIAWYTTRPVLPAAGELPRELTVIEAGARLHDARGATLLIEERSKLALLPSADLQLLHLESGRVQIEVPLTPNPQRWVVETGVARFEAAAARFVVDVEEGRVKVRVDEGSVRAVAREGGVERTLARGETTVLHGAPREAALPAVAGSKGLLSQGTVSGSLDEEREERAPDPGNESASLREGASSRKSLSSLPRAAHSRDGAKEPAAGTRSPSGTVESDPQPPTEPALAISELLVLADVQRHGGDWLEAIATYREVADHPDGAPFAEEALTRRAQLLATHAAADDALTALTEAGQRFPSGALAPERAILEARLHLAQNDAPAAAAAIERTPLAQTPAALTTRVEIAEALAATDLARAVTLVAPVLTSAAPDALKKRARMIERPASSNE